MTELFLADRHQSTSAILVEVREIQRDIADSTAFFVKVPGIQNDRAVADMMGAVLRLVVVSLCAGYVHGYPSGAGVAACPQGSPEVCHGAKPQTSPSPYSVTVHGESYSPGSTVNGRCL